VLLTFDDGPTHYLPDLLSILKNEQVQGMFFWQTRLVQANKTWNQLLQEGHLIGTHGHSHRMFTKLSYEEQYNDIKDSKTYLETLTNTPIEWFRPPFGLYNEDTMKVIQRLDLEIVQWQVASWDWMHQKDENKIIDNVLKHVQPGDIVLLHELPQTVNVLTKLIQGIREMGLKLSRPHTTLQLGNNDEVVRKQITL
jgi:peptidoglycan/xylan/chitin deacetylase (PgdA/CDA1 family)